MNKDDAKVLLPIIQAFSEGIEIERYNPTYEMWEDAGERPEFSSVRKYRVKETPRYTPFSFSNHHSFKDRWIKSKRTKNLYQIILVSELVVGLRTSDYTYAELLENFTFEDGSPCGIRIN